MQEILPLYRYGGKLEFSLTSILISTIINDSKQWDRNIVKGVAISLLKSGTRAEEKDIEKLMSQVIETSDYINKEIIFVDYSASLYKQLLPFAKDLHIKLINNMKTAEIILNPTAFDTDTKILLYEEDQELTYQLKAKLFESHFSITCSKMNAQDQELLESKGVDVVITMTALNLDKNKNKLKSPTKKLKFSKSLISNLPIFLETSVETLTSLTELPAKRLSHGIKTITDDIGENILSTFMAFSGDINGIFILLFPNVIAAHALEAMIGEAVSLDNLEELKDGVGEFCNIITGSIKMKLQEIDLNVIFELPVTFDNVDDTIHKIGSKTEGIWIEMLLKEESFYIFITQDNS